MPKITTILPTYQRPKLLARAIESVLNQTFKDFTLAIYDNHSKDETPDVIESFQKNDGRIVYCRRYRNLGPYENFAKALQQIQTPFFSFLSDDDYLLPWFYESNLKGFEDYPGIGFSASRTLVTNRRGRLSKQQFRYPALKGIYTAGSGAIAITNSLWTPIWTSILFKTDVMQKIGGLDRGAGYAFDLDFILRFACSAETYFSAKPTAVMMTWKEAASRTYATADAFNFENIARNIPKYFLGSAHELSSLVGNLHAIKVRSLKHDWIYGLLSNDLKKADSARALYLDNCGHGKNWKITLISKSHNSYLLRKLFSIYFQALQYMRIFINHHHKVHDSELSAFIKLNKKNKFTRRLTK